MIAMPEPKSVPWPDGFGIVMPHDPAMEQRLMVFMNGNLLPQPGVDYRFDHLVEGIVFPFAIGAGNVVTIVDPLDGRRWVYGKTQSWERLV